MKRLITYLFLWAFLLHTTSKIVVHLNFFINQEYIAENLCENKDKVEMQCNGKCQLMAELEKDDERKENATNQSIEILLLCAEVIAPTFEKCESVDYYTKEDLIAFEENQLPGVSKAIFHPPVFL